jgi:hypothetical protein
LRALVDKVRIVPSNSTSSAMTLWVVPAEILVTDRIAGSVKVVCRAM